MEEAVTVIERLERIAALDRSGAPAAAILAELRVLVGEAAAWAAVEGGEAGEAAVARLRSSLAHAMIEV